ncbi:hypothetical protein HRG_005802 [Hirsutella rhossiliensis]|uniref:Uncharacterized protein n=1 Tax=Hirsutella rhossiliensis TaxID=111463 RepID=A0A9P8MYG5_9HYPO|nr:uncharacterized protein HRG_05802 [Hirsutella rhossiliensis]KAH0963292.1 hypothetical protein HRG_05802 [Hirsutella rhossiliensis]
MSRLPDQVSKGQWLLSNVMRPLSSKYEPYVSDERLRGMNITMSDLDFVSGKPGNGGEQFIEPIPAVTVNQWLNETKPWTIRRDFHVQPEFADNPQNSYRALNSLSRGEADWQVKCILRHNATPHEPHVLTVLDPDLDKPHTICFLADNALLRDDRLSSSEVITVVLLSVLLRAEPKHNPRNHRISPVTIVSASNRSVRIVQGFADIETRAVEIRKSPIVHFDQGVWANWDQWVIVLGWLMGNPIGNTF